MTVLNSKKKTYRTIETQTDIPADNHSELKAKEIVNVPAKPKQTTKVSTPKTPKLPLHKRTKENITHVHSVKQNRKSTGEKYLPLIKSTTISTNPPLKKKKTYNRKKR